MIFLDTHTAVWLYVGDADKFTAQGKLVINSNDLRISPMVHLELQFLFEKKCIAVKPDTILKDLNKRIGLVIDRTDFDSIIVQGKKEGWTNDPFDRIIVAHAKTSNLPLLTKDKIISENYSKSVW